MSKSGGTLPTEIGIQQNPLNSKTHDTHHVNTVLFYATNLAEKVEMIRAHKYLPLLENRFALKIDLWFFLFARCKSLLLANIIALIWLARLPVACQARYICGRAIWFPQTLAQNFKSNYPNGDILRSEIQSILFLCFFLFAFYVISKTDKRKSIWAELQ